MVISSVGNGEYFFRDYRRWHAASRKGAEELDLACRYCAVGIQWILLRASRWVKCGLAVRHGSLRSVSSNERDLRAAISISRYCKTVFLSDAEVKEYIMLPHRLRVVSRLTF